MNRAFEQVYDSRSMGQKKYRILVVDDHPLIREGIAAVLTDHDDLEICGSAEGVDEAIAVAKRLSPDLVIADIALADGDGIELIEQLRARNPQLKVLVISAYDEFLYAERSLRAGADGFINKREVQEKIVDAIRQVLGGERYLSHAAMQRLLCRTAHGSDAIESDPVAQLSNRELQVFRMIGSGMTTSAIAAALRLSVHTIDTHREKIRHKLGLRNGAELMRSAVQWMLKRE